MVINLAGKLSMLLIPVTKLSMVTSPVDRSSTTSPLENLPMMRGLLDRSFWWLEWEMFSKSSAIWTFGSHFFSAIFKELQSCCRKYIITRDGFWECINGLASHTIHSLSLLITIEEVIHLNFLFQLGAMMPLIKVKTLYSLERKQK